MTSAFRRIIGGHDKFMKMANSEKTYSSTAYPPSGDLGGEHVTGEVLEEWFVVFMMN